MDVVSLQVAVTVRVPALMIMLVGVPISMIMLHKHGHTAPVAVVAPVFGGTTSNPLTGWSRYGNVLR